MQNKKGFIFLSLPIIIILIVAVIIGIPLFLWLLSAILPKLIGVSLIILAGVIAVMSIKSGAMNNLSLSLILLFLILGLILMFFPTILGDSLNNLTIMEVIR